MQTTVERFVELMRERPQADAHELAEALIAQGMDAELAECLIAFVPMAFARAVLLPVGTTLPSTYEIRDLDKGESARGQLADEPSFNAGLTLAQRWLDEGRVADVHAIAACSSEYQVACELAGEAQDFESVVCVESVLLRLPLAHLKPQAQPQHQPQAQAQAQAKSWWRRLLG